MTKSNLKARSFYLSDDDWERLGKLAKDNYQTRQAYIRAMIDRSGEENNKDKNGEN